MPTEQPFVWPPRGPQVEAPVDPARRNRAGRHGPALTAALERRSSTWLSQIERTWLDTTAPPLVERIPAEGWRPDAPGDYCWRCGRTLDTDAPTANGCQACEGTRPAWHRMVRLGAYDEPLRQWIHEVKFTRWRRLGLDLGRLLGCAVADEIERVRGATTSEAVREILGRPPVIIPMPTTFWRLTSRGIDHARTIARGVRMEVGGELIQPLRRSPRPSQTEVTPSSRAANVSQAIQARRGRPLEKLGGRLVIVVDDVTTTGSTLRSACRALRQGGLEAKESLLWVAVLGVAGKNDADADGFRTDRSMSA